MILSIVTINLNNKAGLERTLNSLIPFCRDEVEFLVIDGGSTDGSLGIVESSKLINFRWLSESDGGIFHAMNRGIELADGKFVWFMNSGDEAVAGNWLDWFIQQGCVNERVFLGAWEGIDGGYRAPKGTHAMAVGEMPACHQSILYPTSSPVGVYLAKYKIFGDLDFTIRAIDIFGCSYLPDVLSRRECGGVSRIASTQKRVEKYLILKAHYGIRGLLLGLCSRWLHSK